MHDYFDHLAPVYDEWWTSTGRLDPSRAPRPGWDEEVAAVTAILRELQPVRTLDVACGTGFLTRLLPGEVVGLDQSESMLQTARRRSPDSTFVKGDALALPFEDGTFDRVVASHLYAHLSPAESKRFLAEARRVASELILLDTAGRRGGPTERMETRSLADGSRWTVFKRWLTPEQLLDELGGGTILHYGQYFVMVVTAWLDFGSPI
jgi:SAM-dependent methyltransferase